MALVCAVGDRLRGEPEIAARVVTGARGVCRWMNLQAAARREHHGDHAAGDLAHAMQRLHGGVLRMRPDRRLRQDGQAGGPAGTGSGERNRGPRGQGPRRVGPADVAIDLTKAEARHATFPAICPAAARRDRHHGWSPQADHFRQEAERAGLGVVARPIFSPAVNIFQLVVNEGPKRTGSPIRLMDPRSHHVTKRDAPSRTALLLRDSWWPGLRPGQ